MADPGFPVGGGRAPVRRGVDLRRGHFLVKMYAKMKELGPIGGGVRRARPLDPPMITYQRFNYLIVNDTDLVSVGSSIFILQFEIYRR